MSLIINFSITKDIIITIDETGGIYFTDPPDGKRRTLLIEFLSAKISTKSKITYIFDKMKLGLLM